MPGLETSWPNAKCLSSPTRRLGKRVTERSEVVALMQGKQDVAAVLKREGANCVIQRQVLALDVVVDVCCNLHPMTVRNDSAYG